MQLSSALKRIQEFRKLRAGRLSRVSSTNKREMECVVDIREEFYDGDCVKRLVVYLPSLGCEWAFWGAGCNMCGHYLSQGFSEGVVLTPEEIFTAFIKTYKKYRLGRYPIINLYNNGSFFNDRELPEHIRLKILEKLSCCKKLKVVVVESRPECISEDKIRSAVEILGGKKLEVAIGLESSNDVIRNLFLSKGVSLKEFERAVSIVNKHAFSRAYVLLKPPFISEKESINDAISSIRYAFSVGVDTVSLEPATIQEGTLLHYLWSLGEYRPPWLWSIIEVVKRCAEYGKLIVGMFQFYPPPVDIPRNCSKCDEEVNSVIKTYNRTLNADVFENRPYCECYDVWRRLH